MDLKLVLIIIVFMIIGIAVTVFIWPSRYSATKSTIKINHLAEYNRITKPADYDSNNNAAPLYEKAFDAYVEIPDLLKNKNRYKPLEVFSDEEIATLRNWLDLNADCIKYFQQAVVKPYWWIERQTENNPVGEIAFPEVTPFRNTVYVVAWQAKLKAYDGQHEEAFEQLFDIYLASAHLASPKTLVEQLVGLASGGLATRMAFSILDEQIDPNVLKSFRLKLGIYLQNPGINFKYSQGEHLYVLDAIQRCFTDNGNGNGRLIPAVFADFTRDKKNADGSSLRVSYPKAFLISLTHPDKRETIELAKKCYDYYNRLGNQLPWQLHKENTTYADSLAEFTKGNYLLSLGSKSEGLICELKHRCRALNDALITTMAILEYKSHKNEFPEKIDDLIANGYLGSLPIDPYSGKPLVYKKTEGDFMLYSIGADFKDKGGIQSNSWGAGKEGGDQVFWPLQSQ